MKDYDLPHVLTADLAQPIDPTEIRVRYDNGATLRSERMNLLEQVKYFASNMPKLVVNSGTLTASTPLTLSQTWNNGAVTFGGARVIITDTASGASSLPFEVLGGAAGSTSLASVRKDGVLQVLAEIRSPLFSTRSNSGSYVLGSAEDVVITREAANHLALRNGANAQNLSVFNNYVSPSVYERGRFGWSGSNVLQIGTEHVGGVARELHLQTNGTTRVTIAAANGDVTTTGNLTLGGGIYLATGLALGSAGYISWSSGAPSSSGDVQLYRDAANHLALRNSTNAQSFSVYGSYTSPSVYNRLRTRYNGSSAYIIEPEHVGDTHKHLILRAGNTDGLTIRGDLPGYVFINTSLVMNAGTYLQWSGNGALGFAGNGVAQIVNDSSTDFSRFIFGTNNASGVSLAKSGTTLQVKLGDASAFTTLEAKQLLTSIANVAALYALTSAIDDNLYATLGYTTEGIGANIYRYDVGSSATPDYGFVLDGPGGNGTGTGTGRFIAVDQTVADSAKFGAVPGVDSTTAIQRAMNASHANSVPVLVPAGTYPISSTLSCTAGTQKLEIIGAGRAATVIDATGLTNVPAIDIGDSVFTHLRDFKLLGDSSSGHGIQGVDPNWNTGTYLPQHLVIERVFIQGFTGSQTMLGGSFGGSTPGDNKTIPACGLFLAGGLELNIYDSLFYGNDIGVYTFYTGQPKLSACVFDGNALGGWISQYDEKPVIEMCDVLTANPASGSNPNGIVGGTTTLMANTPRRNSATIDTAGLAIIGSHGAVIRDNKFKNSRVNIVLESDFAPVLINNWIRSDVKTGVLSYGPARINENTFYPAYIAPKTFTTAFATNDKLTSTAHGFQDGEEVVLNSTNTLPAGLYANTPLYVKNATANDFELATSPGGSTMDITSDGTGTHSVAIARRDVWYDFPDSNVCYMGSVSKNVFNYGGGGITQAWIHADTPNDSYPIDGVIENNYFGQPYSTANATVINFGVMATGAVRNLMVRDNVYHVPTNATIQFRVFAPTNAVEPGLSFINNVTQTVGGSVTQDDYFPANNVAQTEAGRIGTFTPTLTFNSGNTGMTGTFSGSYTKVGNIVSFAIEILLTAKGSSTGFAVIGGLPFTAKAGWYPPAGLTGVNGMSGITGATGGIIDSGTTNINTTHQGATFADWLYDTNFTNTSHIRVSGSYQI